MAELVAIHWEDPYYMVNQELVLLIMQYVIKIYSAISQISLLESRRVYQITVQ